KEYVELFNDYLDNMNKSLVSYSVQNSYEYSILHLFLITCTLYVFQKEFKKHKYEICADRGLYYYQALNLNHINKLKVIFSKSYTMFDNEKRYIFINKKLDMQADEKNRINEVIYLDELAKAMFENDFEEEDQTYVNFLKTLNESFDEEIEFEENIQTDKTLPSKKDLDKSIQDIMLDKELAKLSIDITFFNIIKQLFPFTEFFMSQPDFFKKMILFFIDSSFDKKHYGNKLFSSFKAHFFKELGIFYA
ncbi:hypothetical protein FI345_09360, partial [Campylobacter jejuni]|nr:hypothetical protein [Campylobacter jejuni]